MKKTFGKILLLCFFFFLFTAPSMAEIKSLKIRSDYRPIIHFQKFGFTHTGFISVAISAVSVTSTVSQPNPSSLAFFLISEESLTLVLRELEQNPNFCIIDSKFILFLFTFRDLSPPPQSSFNKSYPVPYPSEYSLFFANCNPESLVTMDVRTELYNKDDGTTRNYLSFGLRHLPSLYFISSLVYLSFLGLWIFICLKNKPSVQRIHLLMGGLLVVKALSVIWAALDAYYVKVTGTPHGWNVLFYIFEFTRAVVLFTVIVLVGTGWSVLKPLLNKEKKVLMTVIPLQAVAMVAYIVIGKTGPFLKDWVAWNQVFLLLDFICCCAIVFPIVWSIRETFKTDGKAARKLAKFRNLVIAYFCFTRIIFFVLKSYADYKYLWVAEAEVEMATLVFYLAMFYMFRPPAHHKGDTTTSTILDPLIDP